MNPARPVALMLILSSLLLAGCTDDIATTTLEVRFNGQADDLVVKVQSDLSSRPAQARHDADGIPHPDAYTAFDQLVDWATQTGGAFEAQSFSGSFGSGYFLTSLAGVAADGSRAFWSLSINGEESSVGMAEAALSAGDRVTWTYTPIETQAAPGTLAVTVQPPAPVQSDRLVLNGTVSKAASVQVLANQGDVLYASARVDADAAWSVTLEGVAFGRTTLTVLADDGLSQAMARLTAVRLASATFNVQYTASPGHASTSDTVWYDPHAFASAPMYNGTSTQHPGHPIVHDVMVTWTAQTGTPITYSGPGAFGFGVEAIDGIGQPLSSALPPYWCYKINGSSAELGISLQAVAPGDVITWDYGACA
jgi:hypothetical protein